MYRNLLLPATAATRFNLQITSIRFAQKKVPKKDKKMQAAAESLAARGFLRPTKSWDPPANIEETILKICISTGLNEDSAFDSLDLKFKVLKACFDETGYGVPNSLLHSIETVDNLLEFYETPVDTLTPFDSLKKMELPKNMYVQEDYVRFHPEKDTLFNGVSAHPRSSTIVTGLKARKKYEGYTAKRSWP